MALQLTLGRTTFLVRREPAKPAARTAIAQPSAASFAATWMQVFNGTWQAKAGACFPEQLAAQRDMPKTEEIHDQK